MATVRPGQQKALVVIDVQRGVLSGAWDQSRVVANVAHTIDSARHAGVPVLWVQHESDELQPGSEPWQWVPELAPAPGEPTLAKRFQSAFEETGLESALQQRGATHLVLVGAATNWCIRATSYGALDRGYDITLVADAHTTESMDLPGGRRIEAQHVIDELNTVMRWLRYPGRSNTVCEAAALSWAA
jgi:nicotinamidase-related amidase